MDLFVQYQPPGPPTDYWLILAGYKLQETEQINIFVVSKREKAFASKSLCQVVKKLKSSQ